MSEMTKEKPIHVSIVIPVYNEEVAILETIERIRKTMHDSGFENYELIVVNDGSTDKTGERLEDVDAYVINHELNRGYGASLKSGIRAARGDIIVIVDTDGTYPIERIPDLVLNMSDHDMVVGARTSNNVHISLLRRFLKFILQRIASYIIARHIPDLNSGFRAFRRDVSMKYFNIIPPGFSFTSTLTMAMLVDGYQVKFVPIEYFPRLGRSKIKPIRDTGSFFTTIIRTCLYFSPLRVFVPLGGFFLGLAILKLIYDIVYQPLGRFVISQTVLLLSIVAVQIFILGLIADLIVRRTSDR
jgi:glycosyltransferase involved in cell wall biosynthesis